MTEHSTEILPKEYLDLLTEAGGTVDYPVVIKNLGDWNVHKAIRFLRSEEQSLSLSIQALKSILGVITKKSLADLAAQADYGIEPEDLEAALGPVISNGWRPTLRRIQGNTTFVRCNSCEHAWSRVAKGISCSILKHQVEGHEVPYNSSCMLRELSQKKFLELKQILKQKIRTVKESRDCVRIHINILLPFKGDPKNEYPTLQQDRRGVNYNYGDRVRVFVYSPCCRKKDQFTWQPATIVFRDSSEVGVCFDHPIMNSRRKRNDFDKVSWPKHMWSTQSPGYYVMFEWEYRMLRELGKNHTFSKEWSLGLKSESWPWDPAISENFKFHDKRTVSALWYKSVIPEATTDRLMSADEAKNLLGLDTFPEKPKDIVQAFRMRALDDNHVLLERAKNTLLARI